MHSGGHLLLWHTIEGGRPRVGPEILLLQQTESHFLPSHSLPSDANWLLTLFHHSVLLSRAPQGFEDVSSSGFGVLLQKITRWSLTQNRSNQANGYMGKVLPLKSVLNSVQRNSITGICHFLHWKLDFFQFPLSLHTSSKVLNNNSKARMSLCNKHE